MLRIVPGDGDVDVDADAHCGGSSSSGFLLISGWVK